MILRFVEFPELARVTKLAKWDRLPSAEALHLRRLRNGSRNSKGGVAEAEERAAAGRRIGPEAVTEKRAGYEMAETPVDQRLPQSPRLGSSSQLQLFSRSQGRRKDTAYRTRTRVFLTPQSPSKASLAPIGVKQPNWRHIGTWKVSGMVFGSLVESLVCAEAHDSQPQRIDGQLLVLHCLAEDIGNAGNPPLSL